MIDKKKIENLVLEQLTEKDFLVEVKVSKTNKIEIFVDNFDGISIEKCIQISRFVEHSLDRDVEDFELYVSSPGLDKPFKVIEQYKKNLNKQIEVITIKEEKIKGVLNKVEKNEITITELKKVKKEGSKKKQTEEIEHKININNIKSTKIKILFK